MEFRLAVPDDLPNIKEVYQAIVKRMIENKIKIWDDVYPCDFFEEDINKNRLYILLDKEIIAAAFVLTNEHSGYKNVEWQDNTATAVYLDRLGVNVLYGRKGIASMMIAKAIEVGRKSGAQYLRLFVIDENKPAINLYEKNKLIKAKGIYTEIIDDELSFNEYGYEIRLS